MIRELSLKPDFGRTVERFEAWWQRELVDRPPVTVMVRPNREPRLPKGKPATLRERWLNVEYAVESAVAWLECRPWVGDAFPVYWPNVGPEITATVFGCELGFAETTTWSRPVVESSYDWKWFLHRQPDFDNVYWRTMERMTDYALDVCRGRYVVGITDLHGNYDIVAAVRDPQGLCTDLIDCPDLVQEAGRHAARAFVQCFERCYAKVSAAGFGSTSWTGLYHEGPAYVPSCDFWCMVSQDNARDLIVPDLVTEMAPLRRSIFHLDGPGALRHLDLVLSLPGLSALQWVYGAGHGRASDWVAVYRQALDAGKSVQVIADDPNDALAALDALGPHGVWLQVTPEFPSVQAAESFLAEVQRRTLKGRTL